jgi:hypothetical protein
VLLGFGQLKFTAQAKQLVIWRQIAPTGQTELRVKQVEKIMHPTKVASSNIGQSGLVFETQIISAKLLKLSEIQNVIHPSARELSFLNFY